MAKRIRIIPEIDESHLRKQLNDIGKRREKVKVDLETSNIKNTNKQMKYLNTTVNNSNTLFGKLRTTINNTFSTNRVTMTGFLALLHSINTAGKKAKKTIQEIDSAITDLSIATNESRQSVSELVKGYNAYAKELSSTTIQITDSADAYLRAGKTMNEADALIQDSIMLSKLGQISSGEATEDLLATMNGYNMSVDEVSRALDAMVAIDMVAATSAGDIATALKYSASSADMAGVSFNKLAAMIGTVQDKTQQSAETIGTFMNTLLSRYRNVKIGKFVDDDGEDISEVESVLNSLNIKLRDSNQEFRDFESIIDEVALNWENYSSVQQSAIAKAFSGTRQQNRFISLIENYNKTLELTEVAANSAGTAIEKFNNSYKNSLEAKQNTLQAAFESMVMNSDFDEVYSGILEATTALVEFINHTNALKGIASGLSISVGIKGFLAIRTSINESYIALNKFGNALNIVKKTKISTGDYNKLLLLSNGLSSSQMKLVLSTNNLSVARKRQLLMASGLTKQEANLQLQTWGMVNAQTGLTVATTTLGNAFKGLIATMKAHPIMLIAMAVSGVTMVYQSYKQKLEEVRQKNIETSESAIEQANDLKKLYSEYSKLSLILNKTSSEEEEYKSVIEDITKALGDKAKALEGLTVGTNDYAEALAKATKEELQSASVDARIGRKSAEEKLQEKIWSDWSGSKVSIDSNGAGKNISKESQRAVDIVAETMKKFETVNRTWDNLSWDITSDSPEEVLEYYNTLLEAREKLVLASENDEALLDTEIYRDMNSAISTMEDSLDSYVRKRYEEEKLGYMASNRIPQSVDEFQKMQESLIETANGSQELIDKFNTLLRTDFSELANELETVAEIQNDKENIIPNEPFSISDSVKQISEQLEPQFAKLGELYRKIFTDDGFTLDDVDNSMLEELRTAFSDIEKTLGVEFDATELNSFFDILTDGSSTVSDVQNAFDELATSYLNNTDVLQNLNDTTAKSVVKQLEQMGVTNAAMLVEERLIANKEELALKEKFLAEYGRDLKEATEEETKAFLNEANATNATTYALFNYQVQEKIFNNSSLDVSGKVDQLMTLAATYGLCSKVLEDYNTKKELAEKGISIGTNYSEADFNNYYRQMRNELVANLSAPQVEFKDVSSKSKSETESATEILDKYFDYYEKQLQAGQITYKEYVQKCNDIRDKYYKDGKITSAEYYQYLADLYEKELEYHDKAISAVTDAIDDKIDDLEKQKEDIEDYYNGLIENIQNEIDELQKANEERERAIALQKAQYELNRALNQRTDFVLKDDQFVYVPKDGAVKETQNELDDQLFDMRIKDLENQIEDLEKALEDATETIDEQIDSLTKYRDKWSSISAEYEKAQNRIYAASILGANWEADVLNGRLDKLENFKNEYLRIQGELAKASVLGADPGTTSTTGGSGGDSGGSGNIKPTTPTPDTSFTNKSNNAITGAISGVTNALTPGWYVVDKDGNPILSSRCNSQGEATSKIGFYPNGRKVKKYHSGLEEGRVSKYRKLSEDEIVKMFQSFGNGLLKPDEVPAILKAGELVMNQGQQSNIARNMQMIYQNKAPIIPPTNDMKKSQAIVEQHIDIHCPNVTNESGANYIKRELTSLTTKALQFDWNI